MSELFELAKQLRGFLRFPVLLLIAIGLWTGGIGLSADGISLANGLLTISPTTVGVVFLGVAALQPVFWLARFLGTDFSAVASGNYELVVSYAAADIPQVRSVVGDPETWEEYPIIAPRRDNVEGLREKRKKICAGFDEMLSGKIQSKGFYSRIENIYTLLTFTLRLHRNSGWQNYTLQAFGFVDDEIEVPGEDREIVRSIVTAHARHAYNKLVLWKIWDLLACFRRGIPMLLAFDQQLEVLGKETFRFYLFTRMKYSLRMRWHFEPALVYIEDGNEKVALGVISNFSTESAPLAARNK